MMMRSTILFGILLSTFTLIGCDWPLENSSALVLLDANSDRAIFKHYTEYSGFVTLPSTIWALDLDTDRVVRVLAARRQYDVQVEGDFLAAELPDDDNQGSRIVARRISTGEELTVIHRDIQLGGRYDRVFVLDGGRIVARTNEGLLVYSLENNETIGVIPVEHRLVEIHEVGGPWALVVRDNVHSGTELLVNLDTSQVLEIPPVSEEVNAFFFDAVVTDTSLIMTGNILSESASATRPLLQFDIPSQTWRTLVLFESKTSAPFSRPLFFVRGASETHVLTAAGTLFVEMKLELVNRTSLDRFVLDDRFDAAAGPPGATLRDGRVYWVDSQSDTLVSYDLDTQQRSDHQFKIP